MADDTRKVRVEEQLIIKIGEAKNLQSRSNNGTGSNAGYRDAYCTVALDQEEICRTPTSERTLCPFFGEVYQFEIPRKFRYLSVYVYDRDRHSKQDKAIGKVAIRREELHTYNQKDHWFSLRPVDADSEVQGMANIKITIDEGNGNLKRKSDFDDDNNKQQSHDINTNNSIMGNGEHCNNVVHLQNGFGSSSHHGHFKENAVDALDDASAPHSVMPNKTATLSSKTRNIFNSSELPRWNTQPKKSTMNMLDTLSSFRNQGKSRVAIRVVECVDLAKKNGACDPYIILSATYTNKRVIKRRTKPRKKTVSPQFDETHYFDMVVDCDTKQDSNNTYTVAPLGGADLYEICVTVWHDAGMGDNVFLGEVKLPMRGKQQQNALQSLAWYYLQPRTTQSRQARSCETPPGTRLSCDNSINSIGSLRLKLVYSADHVFPLATYDALHNLLLQSVDKRPITSSAVYLLGEVVTSKTDVAQPLVRLFTHKDLIAPIIRALADSEISKLTDSTTIFRGNTLVSKMMDEAMRLSGLHYLHTTLRPIVEQILHERKPCEIDPAKVKDKGVIDSNLTNLQEYVEKVFEAITKSAVRCPAVLCQIFHDLRECAAKHFPQNKEVRYSVVSGFIFLRFFAPAILGPKLFDLTSEPLDPQTNRTLTLISKTIQSLGNLVSSRSAQQPCKEEYTGQLYKRFCTEKHVEAVKHFLEVVSTVAVNNDPDSVILTEPVLLKDGMMHKRAQGRKRFRRRNFKQRYFRLTTHSLSYSKSKGKRTLCDIPLSEIQAVEKVKEGSFKMQNIFQIVRKEGILYIQTANCVEEKEWMDLLNKICQTNAARLNFFHPCAYINGKWTCCEREDDNAHGCTSVSPKSFQIDLANALDPPRDLQRLHTLIMSYLPQLESLAKPNTYPAGATEDPAQTRLTLQALTEVAHTLDKVHRKYKSTIAKEMKYGSRMSPIGDDNYLHMNRSNLNVGCLSSPPPRLLHQL